MCWLRRLFSSMDSEVLALAEDVRRSQDVVGLAAALLRYCRAHARALRGELASRRAEFRALRKIAAEELPETESLLLDAEDLDRFVALLAQLVRECRSVPLAARALAEAVDDAWGPDLINAFTGAGTIRLLPGEPVPVQRRPAKELFGHDVNTLPEHQGVNVDGLQHLRIAPADLGALDACACFEHEHALVPLSTGDRIGVGLPYAGLDDFVFDRTEVAGDPRFFGVRPKRRDQQRGILRALLDTAEESLIAALVLPELCVDDEGQAIVEEWWREKPRRMKLVVAGSRHLVDSGVQRNRSTTLLQRGDSYSHDKFNPFVFPPSAGRDADRREDIDVVPAEITIHFASGYSVTTLICKDILERGVTRILSDLRVNLVLVPSFSSKTGGFEDAAAELAREAQAVVVVANTPAGGSSDQALFRLPRTRQGLMKVAGQPSGTIAWVELGPAGVLMTR